MCHAESFTEALSLNEEGSPDNVNDPVNVTGGQSGKSIFTTPERGHPPNEPAPQREEPSAIPEVAEEEPKKRRYAAPLTPYIKRLSKRAQGATIEITPAGLEMIETLAAGGHSDTRIAGMIGVRSRLAFNAMKKSDPRIEEAMASGRAVLESELVSLLLGKARNGEVVPLIYLTKTLCGFVENGTPPPSRSITQNTQINIHMPAPMSAAQFSQLLPPQVQEALDADGDS